MAKTLKIRKMTLRIEDESGNLRPLVGRLEVPEDIEIEFDEGYDATAVVADNFGTATLWETGQGGLSTFHTAYFEANAELVVEFETTAGEFVLTRIDEKGQLLLRSDDFGGDESATRLDGAVLVDGTDFDQVVAVRVQRDVADDEGDAIVRMILLG